MPIGDMFVVLYRDQIPDPPVLEQLFERFIEPRVSKRVTNLEDAVARVRRLNDLETRTGVNSHRFFKKNVIAAIESGQRTVDMGAVHRGVDQRGGDLRPGEQLAPATKPVFLWNVMTSREFNPPFLDRFGDPDESQLMGELLRIETEIPKPPGSGPEQDRFNGFLCHIPFPLGIHSVYVNLTRTFPNLGEGNCNKHRLELTRKKHLVELSVELSQIRLSPSPISGEVEIRSNLQSSPEIGEVEIRSNLQSSPEIEGG